MHEAIPAHTTHQHQGKCQVFPPPNPLLSNLPAGCGNFQKGKRWLCLVFPLFGCLHTGRETVMKELLQSSHNLATQSTSHTRLETDLTAELQRKQGLVWKPHKLSCSSLFHPLQHLVLSLDGTALSQQLHGATRQTSAKLMQH